MKLTAASLEINEQGLATVTLTQAEKGNPFNGTFAFPVNLDLTP